MAKAIYSSQVHESIVNVYITLCNQFVQELTTKAKYNNFLEVQNTIIEYHNEYGKNIKNSGGYYDWIMILPINISVATNGFFAALETKNNRAVVRAYKVVLEQMLHETCERLESLELKNE
jgi:hypothetical protein